MVRRTVEIPDQLDAQVQSLLAKRGGSFDEWVRESLQDRVVRESGLAQTPRGPGAPPLNDLETHALAGASESLMSLYGSLSSDVPRISDEEERAAVQQHVVENYLKSLE